MPTITNEIQGYKEMTDTTETSTLPPVETTQPNASNESSHNQLHSTIRSDQSLPKTITMPSIN